jgi:hypothetical protein
MGDSNKQGGVGDGMGGLMSGDYLDPTKLGALPPDLSNSLTPVDQMKPVDGGVGKGIGKAAGGILSSIGASMNAQQPMAQGPNGAGPQLGAPVNQAPGASPNGTADYLKQLQLLAQQNQGGPYFG